MRARVARNGKYLGGMGRGVGTGIPHVLGWKETVEDGREEVEAVGLVWDWDRHWREGREGVQ